MRRTFLQQGGRDLEIRMWDLLIQLEQLPLSPVTPKRSADPELIAGPATGSFVSRRLATTALRPRASLMNHRDGKRSSWPLGRRLPAPPNLHPSRKQAAR